MATIRVKNWDRFQHYKDRNPPWIKLHYDLLSSSDWVMLDDRNRLLAIVCMLLASRHEGCVPDDMEYIRRVAYLDKLPDLQPLIDSGFLEVEGERKQMLADARPEERRGEKRQRRGEIPFSDFWAIYPNHQKPTPSKKKWEGLTVKDQQAAMTALPNHLANWNDPKFVPHATTWLNQRRWEDEIPGASIESGLDKEIALRAKKLKARCSDVLGFYQKNGYLPTEQEQLNA